MFGVLVLFIVLGGGVRPVWGQSEDAGGAFCEEPSLRTVSLDTRGLGLFYCSTNPVLRYPLRAAHASARPVFYGAVPAAWAGAFVFREEGQYTDAYRLTVSQGATYGLVFALKRIVGRPRPYVRRALTSRSSHFHSPSHPAAFTSFPSGHAALSATLVTSWSLSHPRWYVIGPGAAWATAVTLSRIYLGVHYPSDVLVGASLGVGMAFLVHQLRTALTPDVVRAGPQRQLRAPPVTLRIQF